MKTLTTTKSSLLNFISLSLFLVLSALLTVVRAETFGDFTYTTNALSATITKYNGPGGDVIIPDTIEGKPVTSIGTNAFSDSAGLTSIALPEAVTNIGNFAFARCANLTSVPITVGVTTIGIGSFSDCVRLSNIELPASVMKIMDRAFSGCAAVTNITIAAGTTNIGALAFFGCNSLMNITVDPLNTAFSSVDGVLFNKNQSLLIHCPGARFENYRVPKSVKTVQDSAFSGCSRLTAITVDPLNTAFYSIDGALYLTSLTNLVACPAGKSGSFSIAEKTTCILSFAFSGCSRLTNIVFPTSAYSIRSNAFLNCTGLTDITIPPDCRGISDFAFSGCTGLKNVVIPIYVNIVYYSAFNNCTNLSGLYFQGNRPTITYPGTSGYLFDGAVHATVYYRPGTANWGTNFGGLPVTPWLDPQATDFVWKQKWPGVAVTNYTGSGGNVSIPATIFGYAVIIIGDSAFAGQTNLASLTIPNTVTNIGVSAFADCTHLTSVFFNGNAPTVSGTGDLFTNAPNVTVYYSAGTTGWGSTFAGRPTAVWIEQSPITDFTYTTNEVSATITGYTGSGGNVIIPDAILDIPVTDIGGSAFLNNTSLTGVTMGTSVIRIGDSAFLGCTSLTNITLPTSVTSIGEWTFYNCSNLISIVIPNGVTNIGTGAFAGCNNLMSITIPKGVTIISDWAFSRCTKLTSVTIPDSVTNIRSSAFYDCSALTNITLPNSVTSIGEGTFDSCGNLTGIVIPNGVTSILYSTFANCTRLASITIPDSVTSIGISAFYGCAALTNITIPNNVTNVGNYVFQNCTSLTNIMIPDCITRIADGAFYGCSNLTGIVIPNSVTNIGNAAFLGCTSLKTINIPNNVTYIGSAAFNLCTRLTSVAIPQGVTAILDSTFTNCINLTNITIPDSVTSIGSNAFHGCGNLTGIVVPNSVTILGSQAFAGCAKLKAFTIPNSVYMIGDNAFDGCTGLTSITIPSTLTKIGVAPFSGCRNLMAIMVDPLNTAYVSIDGILFRKNQTFLIQFPEAKGGDYVVPATVTTIGISAFADCGSLTSITLPGSVTWIADYAFARCADLKSVTILEGVTGIGISAFSGCNSLTTIALPASVRAIADGAFARCSELTEFVVDPLNAFFSSVDGVLFSKNQRYLVQYPNGRNGTYMVPESITSIKDSAFSGCTRLTAINVEPLNDSFSSVDGVLFNKNQTKLIACPGGRIGSYTITNTATALGNYAFSDCIGLTNISIPSTINTISSNAFCNCTGLTSIIISTNVNRIYGSAFYGCTGLTSITIPKNVSRIESAAFNYCTKLTSVYFEGNAPSIPYATVLFDNSDLVIVYYRAGTTGWASTFAGRPTALWVEQPTYQAWAQTSGLLAKFPDLSAEGDDPDHDGMSNLQEMQAGTDPTTATSVLKFESNPRPNDLEDADKTAIGSDQHALYFQTVQGKKYEIQSLTAFGEAWQSETNATATTTQKRVLISKPTDKGFYRVVLVP